MDTGCILQNLKAENHIVPAEYLLVLQPHEALWNEIKSCIKKNLQADYSCEQARRKV